jgi:hypothetical protein
MRARVYKRDPLGQFSPQNAVGGGPKATRGRSRTRQGWYGTLTRNQIQTIRRLTRRKPGNAVTGHMIK